MRVRTRETPRTVHILRMHRVLILAACLAAPISTAQSSAAKIQSVPAAGPSAPSRPGSTGRPAEPQAETIEIQTGDKHTLAGSFYAVLDASQLAPAALLVHDAGADRSQLDDVALKLQKLGVAVLAIDLRGHGKSATKDFTWSLLDESGKKALWAAAPRDLQAAAGWLREQKGLHTTKLCVVGVGSACSLAVRHAAKDDNVRCTVLIEPSAEDFGFAFSDQLCEIQGVPTKVFAKRDNQQMTAKLFEKALAAAHGIPTFDIEYAGTKAENLLADKKTAPQLAKWIKEQVVERKGDGKGK